MTSKTKIFSLLTAAALAFASCQKPVDDVPAAPPAKPPRVSKITYPFESVSYAYNADGTLKESLTRNTNGTETGRLSYTYDNGKLKEGSSGAMKTVYTYPDASTTQIDLKSITGRTLYSYEYKFNGSRLVEWVQYTYLVNGTKQPDEKVVNTYNNAGNIVKSEHYTHMGANWMRDETVDVQYDDKVNYTSHVDNMAYYLGPIRILTNNPLKAEHRNINGTVFKTVTYQHSYDASGKKTRSVVKTVETGLPDETETITFEY